MRASSLRGPASRLAFLCLCTASGASCSLLNALDEVKPQLETGDGAPPAVDAGDGDGAADAASADPKGVIVVGGVVERDGGREAVLTALAPETGLELPMARRPMIVVAARYDGIRDLWYVFESGGSGNFPQPSDPVFLHVFRLDTHTGAWEELQQLRVPTLVAFTHVGVLRERLVYVAYRANADSATATDLVTIDTTDPTNLGFSGTPQPLSATVIGLMATRSQTGNPGSVNLLEEVSCSPDPDAGGTCLAIENVRFPAGGPPQFQGTPMNLGPIFGSPAYGSYIRGSSDLVGFKAPGGGATVDLKAFDPVTLTAVGQPTSFDIYDFFLKPLAIAECQGQALVMGTNQELGVYAVPLTATKPVAARGGTGHSGQGVYFEPFTNTVLAPFSQGEGYQLTALRLAGERLAPTLTPRQAPDWTPPAELRPEIVATREPYPPVCPE